MQTIPMHSTLPIARHSALATEPPELFLFVAVEKPDLLRISKPLSLKRIFKHPPICYK